MNKLHLNGQVRIYADAAHSAAIAHVLRMLKRDLTTVLGSEPEWADDPRQAQIRIAWVGENDCFSRHPEAFEFRTGQANHTIIIRRGKSSVIGYKEKKPKEIVAWAGRSAQKRSNGRSKNSKPSLRPLSTDGKSGLRNASGRWRSSLATIVSGLRIICASMANCICRGAKVFIDSAGPMLHIGRSSTRKHSCWLRNRFGIYRADWLTNISSTAQNVDTLRKVLHMQGDSPDSGRRDHRKNRLPINRKSGF